MIEVHGKTKSIPDVGEDVRISYQRWKENPDDVKVVQSCYHTVSNIDLEPEDGGQAFVYSRNSKTGELVVFYLNNNLLEHLANLYVESL